MAVTAGLATTTTAMGTTGEMGTLESIHHNLASVMAEGGVKGSARAVGALDKPRVWVVQYVDYTSKYGLGYLLSDGSTGVYFNDSTKIVLAAPVPGRDDSELCFQYMERVRGEETRAASERFEAHTLGAYPPALHKKVTLLQHFRDYLVRSEHSNCVILSICSQLSPPIFFRCNNRRTRRWGRKRLLAGVRDHPTSRSCGARALLGAATPLMTAWCS
jgi:hypothetical protein